MARCYSQYREFRDLGGGWGLREPSRYVLSLAIEIHIGSGFNQLED
jgi:hypothetical protein